MTVAPLCRKTKKTVIVSKETILPVRVGSLDTIALAISCTSRLAAMR